MFLDFTGRKVYHIEVCDFTHTSIFLYTNIFWRQNREEFINSITNSGFNNTYHPYYVTGG